MEKRGGRDLQYFGVVEAGEETGRLHIHTVLICDVLPCEVSDPNPVKGGTNRVVEELRKYWPHGHSSPVAVRWARDARWFGGGRNSAYADGSGAGSGRVVCVC